LSGRRRDVVFGAIYNAFATKFTGFSACHPVYGDTNAQVRTTLPTIRNV